MTEKTKLEQFYENLISKIYDGTIKDVYVNNDIKDYRQDNRWFNGEVISFNINNLKVKLDVVGGVRANVIYQYWDKEAKQTMTKSEPVIDKNFSGKLGETLKKDFNIFSDAEITTDFAEFINCGKMKEDGTKEYSKKVYIDYYNESQCELVITDNRTDENIDCGDQVFYELPEVIKDFDKFLNEVKEYAGDRLDENYETKTSGYESIVPQYEYEKEKKLFLDILNYKPEVYEKYEYNKEDIERIESFKDFKDKFLENYDRKREYTIEAMFKSKGVAKVFDDRGVFTKEALEKYDEVSDEFFDGITDNLDKLCHEEDCFEEDIDDGGDNAE
jgi:hypothetical protein